MLSFVPTSTEEADMRRNTLQANDETDWEQRDLIVQVDKNLRRAYPATTPDDLPEPIRRALEKLQGRAAC